MQKRMQQRWEMSRWVSQYIEQNQESWERGEREREIERKKKVSEWEKMKRFEKIEYLRKRDREEEKGRESTEMELEKEW